VRRPILAPRGAIGTNHKRSAQKRRSAPFAELEAALTDGGREHVGRAAQQRQQQATKD
jgi:hypothetical protein